MFTNTMRFAMKLSRSQVELVLNFGLEKAAELGYDETFVQAGYDTTEPLLDAFFTANTVTLEEELTHAIELIDGGPEGMLETIRRIDGAFASWDAEDEDEEKHLAEVQRDIDHLEATTADLLAVWVATRLAVARRPDGSALASGQDEIDDMCDEIVEYLETADHWAPVTELYAYFSNESTKVVDRAIDFGVRNGYLLYDERSATVNLPDEEIPLELDVPLDAMVRMLQEAEGTRVTDADIVSHLGMLGCGYVATEAAISRAVASNIIERVDDIAGTHYRLL